MLVEIIHQQHLELRELFTRHQEMLLELQLEEAKHWLEQFDVCQTAHMHIEERYLFPEFSKIRRESKWDVSLYEKEHEKIKHLYANIVDDLNWLAEQDLDRTQLRRNILALLDKEKTLKGLNEHHEAREEEAMLKELDQQLEQRSRKEIELDIKLTWVEVIASIKETVV